MTINSLFPISESLIYPDNGMLTMAYDRRVSQNDMLKISSEILQQDDAYYREERLDGTGIYTWSQRFIDMIILSFTEGKIANFSVKQRKLFDEYIQIIKDSGLATASEEIKALDTYLGGL